MIMELIEKELAKRKVHPDDWQKVKDAVVDTILLDIPRFVEIAIKDKNLNRGRLKEGWTILMGGDPWEVVMVNESRCRVMNINTSEFKDITPYAEVQVIIKPEEDFKESENNEDGIREQSISTTDEN